MVYVIKKLSDVAFEYPAGFGVVLADFVGEWAKSIQSIMGSFVVAAGKRIRNESSVKERIQYSVNGVMKQSVSDRCFVDVPWFGVVDSECLIATMLVGVIFKVLMKTDNIIHQSQLKLLDVSFLSFPSQKFFPGFQNIFEADNIFVVKNRPSMPPPDGLLADTPKAYLYLQSLAWLLGSFRQTDQIRNWSEDWISFYWNYSEYFYCEPKTKTRKRSISK